MDPTPPVQTEQQPKAGLRTREMPVDPILESLGNGDGDPDLPSGDGNYRCGRE